MLSDGPKIAYSDWLKFRDNVMELREERSWTEISALFGKDNRGWAENAAKQRGLVSEADVKQARDFVDALPKKAPPSKNGKQPTLEERTRDALMKLYKRCGNNWSAAARAMGKNAKASGYYSDIAKGKAKATQHMLDAALAALNGQPPPVPTVHGAHNRQGTKVTDYPQRGGPITDKQREECREILLALHKRFHTWDEVAMVVRGKRSAASGLRNVVVGKGGGSQGLLKLLRKLSREYELPGDTGRVKATKQDLKPSPKKEDQQHVAEQKATPPAPVIPAPMDWPQQAQEHLKQALLVIERGTAALPKRMREQASDAITQIKLAIEELQVE